MKFVDIIFILLGILLCTSVFAAFVIDSIYVIAFAVISIFMCIFWEFFYDTNDDVKDGK